MSSEEDPWQVVRDKVKRKMLEMNRREEVMQANRQPTQPTLATRQSKRDPTQPRPKRQPIPRKQEFEATSPPSVQDPWESLSKRREKKTSDSDSMVPSSVPHVPGFLDCEVGDWLRVPMERIKFILDYVVGAYHHGICVGREVVKERGSWILKSVTIVHKFGKGIQGLKITENEFWKDWRIERHAGDKGREIARRAEERFNRASATCDPLIRYEKYDLGKSNCEHFAADCFYGTTCRSPPMMQKVQKEIPRLAENYVHSVTRANVFYDLGSKPTPQTFSKQSRAAEVSSPETFSNEPVDDLDNANNTVPVSKKPTEKNLFTKSSQPDKTPAYQTFFKKGFGIMKKGLGTASNMAVTNVLSKRLPDGYRWIAPVAGNIAQGVTEGLTDRRNLGHIAKTLGGSLAGVGVGLGVNYALGKVCPKLDDVGAKTLGRGTVRNITSSVVTTGVCLGAKAAFFGAASVLTAPVLVPAAIGLGISVAASLLFGWFTR